MQNFVLFSVCQTEPQVRFFSQFELEKEVKQEPQKSCKPSTFYFIKILLKDKDVSIHYFFILSTNPIYKNHNPVLYPKYCLYWQNLMKHIPLCLRQGTEVGEY